MSKRNDSDPNSTPRPSANPESHDQHRPQWLMVLIILLIAAGSACLIARSAEQARQNSDHSASQTASTSPSRNRVGAAELLEAAPAYSRSRREVPWEDELPARQQQRWYYTVTFLYGNGPEAERAFPDQVYYDYPGTKFDVEIPEIEGYFCRASSGQRMIQARDATEYACYYPLEDMRTLIIHYVDREGNEMFPSTTMIEPVGYSFQVYAPEYPDMYVSLPTIWGNFGDRTWKGESTFEYSFVYHPIPKKDA